MNFVYHFIQNKLNFVEKVESSLDEYTIKLPPGLFTTFRTYDSGKKGIGITKHLQRLNFSEEEELLIRSSIRQVITDIGSQGNEWKIRLQRSKFEQLECFIILEKFVPIESGLRKYGITVDLSDIIRNTPHEKSTDYIKKSIEKRIKNNKEGIYESLIVSSGKIREGFTSNFFYVIDNCLHTAKNDILMGVTRSRIISIAKEEGIGVAYRSLNVDQIDNVKECFISSSSRGIIPICKLRTFKLYRWGRGPITNLLQQRYEAYESKSLESF